jgi:hypothetical protein
MLGPTHSREQLRVRHDLPPPSRAGGQGAGRPPSSAGPPRLRSPRAPEGRAGRWTGRRRTRSPAPMRVLTGRGQVRFLASRGRWSSRGAIPHGKGGGARERPVWQPGPARAGPHLLGRIVVPGGLGRPLRRQSGRRRRARDEERVVAGDRAARLRPMGTSSAAAIACADPGSVTRTTKMPPTLRPDASVAPGLRAEPAAALIGRHWPGTEGPCQ